MHLDSHHRLHTLHIRALAAGCLVQISGFATLAIRSKLIVPHAHTSLEMVKVRYGPVAHAVFIFLCLLNNLIAVVNMFLGSSATISALTGMNTVAAIFLLPVGVCLYTITGGLRATFITDYLHTVALLIIATYLVIKTVTNPAIGSPAHLLDLVNQVAAKSPVSGNAEGSYFTMASKSAIEFGILHTLGNFALVIMDSEYACVTATRQRSEADHRYHLPSSLAQAPTGKKPSAPTFRPLSQGTSSAASSTSASPGHWAPPWVLRLSACRTTPFGPHSVAPSPAQRRLTACPSATPPSLWRAREVLWRS